MSQETERDEILFFKALADESRLKIISILLEKDSYAEYLAEKLNLTAPTVTYHMNKLEKAGIVTGTQIQHYVIYTVNRELMDKKIGDFIRSAAPVDDTKSYEEKVINSFFKCGRLTKLPSQIKKREIVLGYIAEKFEPDRTYTEKEVNAIIAEMYDDYCTVRREMVEIGFMERPGGEYRRVK